MSPNRPLTNTDRSSDTWMRIREFLEKRLEGYRAQNDGDLPPDATAKLRGRIAEVKAIIALGAPEKEIPEDDTE